MRAGHRELRRRCSACMTRIPLNLFGIGFGLSGLAGTWTAVADVGLGPAVVGDVLWLVAAAVWLVTLVRYAARAGGARAVLADLRHPVLGPFAALAPTTALLLGGRLDREDRTAGQVLVVAALVVATAFGVWFLATLLEGGRDVDTLHGGYLLPTTAAALVGAQALAVAGWDTAARAAFAAGVLSWLLVGAVLLARLALRPALPAALVPTLAIFSAPPAVAGNAWFAIDGGRTDTVQHLLLGTFVLLLTLQLALVPRYARLPFALGWWALTFTAAASATYGVRWLALSGWPGWSAYAWAVVGLTTALIAMIAGRSIVLVRTPALEPAVIVAKQTSPTVEVGG